MRPGWRDTKISLRAPKKNKAYAILKYTEIKTGVETIFTQIAIVNFTINYKEIGSNNFELQIIYIYYIYTVYIH